MHRSIRITAVGVLLLATNSLVLAGGSWPHWRGPTGNGVSPDGKPPVEWSDTKNVRWKVKIPGWGSGSPVIWQDKIFIVTAIAKAEAGARESRSVAPGQDRPRRRRGGGRGRERQDLVAHEFVLLCLDRKSGKTIWQKTAAERKPHEGSHSDHGFASASPCTDGELVYAHFGSRGLFAFTMEGKPAWNRTDLGSMTMRGTFGEGSSPVLHGDRILVPWDHEGPSYIASLDKKTGKTVWRIERDEPSCWATPLVVEHGGKKQVIASGQNFVRGYDFESGKEIWRCDGQTGRPVASPVAGHGLAFVGSGFRGNYMAAFKLDKAGDLRDSGGVVWELEKNTPDVPSPVLSGKRLYFHAGRSGTLSCYDAVSGKALFGPSRVSGLRSVYASPVAANGHVYLTGRDGVTVVIKDADKLEVVATNSVGEPVDATPAIVDDELYIRGKSHLFCVAK